MRDGINILCMQGAWMLVARTKVVGEELELSDVACIRRWGTSAGVGQLAKEGPLQATVMDNEPDQIIDRIQVIRAIPCEVEAWERSAAWHGSEKNKRANGKGRKRAETN